MEYVSYRLTNEIRQRRGARIIAWGGSQKLLPFFLVSAFVRALAMGLVGKVDLIHLGDPVLSIPGYLLGRMLRVPVAVTVHGLDVIYPNWFYQRMVTALLPTFDAVIAISSAAQAEGLKRGVRPERSFVVTIGVDPPVGDLLGRAAARDQLATVVGAVGDDRVIILTAGRLVRRKGVAWFVEEVLPLVVRQCPEAYYVVAGAGPDEERIREAIERVGLTDRVRLAGKVSNHMLWNIYRACNLFVMPNIAVEGDMEGFGLVAIEAGLAERYVVASALEGIRDAIVPPHNGEFVPPGDALSLAAAIVGRLANLNELDELGRQARVFVLDRFGWKRIVDDYLRIFDACRWSSANA